MTRVAVARANTIALTAWVVVLLLVGGLTWDRFISVQNENHWVLHTDEVRAAIKDLDLDMRSAESGQRGYLLTGDEEYLFPYKAGTAQIPRLQSELQILTADNPAQQERLRALAPIVQRKLAELAQTIRLRRDAGPDAALRIVRTGTGRDDMRRIQSVLDDMAADEQALRTRRLAAASARGAWLGAFALAAAVLAVAALAWAAHMVKNAWATSYRMEEEQRTLAVRLRASLDSLSQGVAVFDAERRLINWNECFQLLLDIPDSLLRAGTPYAAISRFLADRGEPLLESEADIAKESADDDGAIVHERHRPNGQFLEIRRTAMPLHGFVLTISDLTKRAQAEAVLRESQKMQAIGQLTGGIAHDFNNLLTVILGNLETAQRRLPAEHQIQNQIERAVWATRRGATLTAQLLAFARKQPLAPAPLDLSEIVPDLLPLLERSLGAPIDVRYVGAADLWPAMADAAQLENAVLNLALNARDAMPDGGCLTLELANATLDENYARAHAEVTAGDYVMLAVSDTGSGMTPEVAARVFEPFFTTKPDGKGTGLGLAMVFGFVKQSRGHVKIYTEPGDGTSVKIYLPRASSDAKPVVARILAPIERAAGEATVLVVEDEPGVREVAVTILRDCGYRVVEAADGDEALSVFAAHASEIDLLLTDVVLPGKLRGRDVAERIRAQRPEVRVLFMSGYTENSIVHHGRLDEGVNLISKPFTREELASKLAEIFRALPESSASEGSSQGTGNAS